MTLSSATSKVSYTGNGAVDTYAYTFKIFSSSDLLVVVRDTSDVETTLTLNTDYTVTGVGSTSGGNVVLVNASQAWLDVDGDLKSGYVLNIRRVRDLVQETDIRNQGAFYPEIHEDQFDILTMQDQQQQDEIDRSIKLPETISTADFDPTLPTDIGTASTVLAINSTGDGFEIGPTTAAISSAATEAANAATSADLAEDWANKTTGVVASSEYSAKAYAIGGTGVSDTASKGAAKEWAIETSGTVDGTDYSAKEHAKGTQTRGLSGGGSAKDWATYTSSTVDDTEYSAKKYAQNAAASASEAATYASASLWNDVSYKVFADSPITVSDSDSGRLFAVDCTGGNVVINLPAISGLSLTGPWAVGFKKTDSSSNTITVNRNGTDTIDGATSKTISRQYSGCSLVPDVDGSPDNWTAIGFGEVPISGAIVGTTDTQTLTNKTLGDAPTFTQIATPSSPSSGFNKIYPKSDGFFYTLNSSGTEVKVGSGGGGINYLEANPDFESATTGYSAYADAAATSPVDGTGGSPVTTIARSTSSPLRGTASGLFSKSAANRQGEGFSYAFSIATADQGKVLQISYEYTVGSSYVDADMRMFIYDVTNSVLIEPSQRDIQANGGQAKYLGFFQASSTSTSYRIIWHVASTSALAYDFKIDNVVVGPVNIPASSSTVAFRMVKTSNQAIATASFTKVTFTSVSSSDTGFDYSGGADTVNSRFTAPESGIYFISSSYDTSATDAGAGILGAIYKNGSLYTRVDTAPGSVASNQIIIQAVINLIKGDYVEIFSGTKGGDTAYNVIGGSGNDEHSTFQGYLIKSDSSTSGNSSIAFRATRTGNQSISAINAKITLDTVTATNCYNIGGGFNTTNTRFEAPDSGVYSFYGKVVATSYTANERLFAEIWKNGSAAAVHANVDDATSGYSAVFATLNLVKGDYVELYVSSEADTAFTVSTGADLTVLEGFKINTPSLISPKEFVGCSYETNTASTFASGSYLTFEDKVYDSHGFSSDGLTFTIPVSGKYSLTAYAGLAAVVAGVNNYIVLYAEKNGATNNIFGCRQRYQTTSSVQNWCGGTLTMDLRKGDVIKIFEDENVTNALALTGNAYENYIQITKVS